MHYIVFDLEFNQHFPSLQFLRETASLCPFEIIQIGAIKLDSDLKTIATFDRYVKPMIYSEINPLITNLTGITTNQLSLEATFPEVYNDYIKFIDSNDNIFCIWGISDIKELFRNAAFHKLNQECLTKQFLNLQPYVSMHLNLSPKKLLKLEHAVEAFNILQVHPFHNALHDAYYTSELLKKIYTPSIQPSIYDPTPMMIQKRQPKKVIDYDGLFQQFEKMYHRNISEEEKEMIQLAYKMGKTHQFLK